MSAKYGFARPSFPFHGIPTEPQAVDRLLEALSFLIFILTPRPSQTKQGSWETQETHVDSTAGDKVAHFDR